ncbi:MAG TPA: NUDIX hydrolase [Gaiellaceae bacterium]|nr:NUDIX hydrolase [Gaiellaceae bacterium]
MMTKTRKHESPPGYDPSQFPSFAVTVDVVVLTTLEDQPHVLLVRRAVSPFEGMWAIPGGFKRPSETLDEAAQRELLQETGIDGTDVLVQIGTYGDPGRDPRMNVVTVAYRAVLRDVEGVVAGADAAAASLVPVSSVLSRDVELAFDHARIVRDALESIDLGSA